MRSRYALLPAAVPIVALVFGLPFVNRLEPVVLGLPFLLFWMLGWVLLTPGCLALAYFIARRPAADAPQGRDRA